MHGEIEIEAVQPTARPGQREDCREAQQAREALHSGQSSMAAPPPPGALKVRVHRARLIAQAQEFYRALVERNIPVEFVVYPREGHGINEPRHALDRIRRYVWFFTKYLSQPNATEPAQ